MKRKTKYGWFDMSEIFYISNLTTESDVYAGIKYFFNIGSKYDTVLVKIEGSANYDSIYSEDITAKQEHLGVLVKQNKITEDERWDQYKLLLEEINKRILDKPKEEYDAFVNLWLENKNN